MNDRSAPGSTVERCQALADLTCAGAAAPGLGKRAAGASCTVTEPWCRMELMSEAI